MLVTIHQPEHLPWLGLLAKVSAADLWIVLDNVAYRKNYFQNRNRIVLSGQPVWLTVPVHARHGVPIHDVAISDAREWRRKYIGTLMQAYGKAPFAEAIQPLADLIAGEEKSLADLNMALFAWMAAATGVETPMERSSALEPSGAKSELLLHLCQAAGATTYLAGPSGRDYLDHSLFEAAGIAVRYFDFRHPSYAQMSDSFVPAMSAVDAIANLGPASASLLSSEHWDLAESK